MPLSFRTRLIAGLVVAGAVAGAVIGIGLTYLGKLVAGAPPATISNYAWNAAVFGLMAGVVSPVVTWSALRRVPLWRTIVEPLVAGIGGAAIGALVGSGPLFLALFPLGAAVAVMRLGYTHRERKLPRQPS